MSSPTPGNPLIAASTTFTWNAGSGGVTGYYLWIGTSVGTANLANIGVSSSTTQATVTLPTNGATIYVQLWTKLSSGELDLQQLHLHRRQHHRSYHEQSHAGQPADRSFDHLYLERWLRRSDRLLPVDWHIGRHCQSGEHRCLQQHHPGDRNSAHQRSHDLRRALDKAHRRQVCSPTATPTPKTTSPQLP